ncbi:hypothetical protein FGIG_08230 [Fasciola gigantica]|uniref:Uncharacterized protein n=1 Tax=Fasciola gigantica TaxID=46835 RepID=A0A504YPX8_FASGI|nr:hypothetical protein FGIG_08230 [Fasciola gigantica]
MYHSSSLYCSHLDSLLSQEDLTLDDILTDPSVVDECKAENKSLLTFITQPHCLRQLVEHSVSGPDLSVPVADQFRRCHIASELLSSGGPRMSCALLRDTDSLDVLYEHLHDRELTHLSASFLCRIISSLLQCSGEVQTYFAQKTDLSECILTNIDKPSILDLFYSFIQSPTNPEISLQLSDSTLISDLIGLLSTDQPDEVNVSLIYTHDSARCLNCLFYVTIKIEPCMVRLPMYSTGGSLTKCSVNSFMDQLPA